MNNKIKKIDSSASPTQMRAYHGPATCGMEFDIASAVQQLVLEPDGTRRTFYPTFTNAGAPTSGTSGTFAGKAPILCLLVDITNTVLYMNTNTVASPTWTKLYPEAPGDVSLASGHILVGNGSGVAADVALSGDATMANTGAITVVSLGAAVTVKLGAAVTVQSPPLVGIAPDLSSNASGTTQSTFYTLNSIALPANALSANGKGIMIEAFGITAGNANAKDFKITFGSASVTLTTGNTGNGVPFWLSMMIYRTGVGTQQYAGLLTIGTASSIPVQGTTAADETAAWTIALQSQNTAAAAASATGKGMVIAFQN